MSAKMTYISCETGFWVIDTQEIARITWHPEDDTFTYDGARHSREEMKRILESPEMLAELAAEDPWGMCL